MLAIRFKQDLPACQRRGKIVDVKVITIDCRDMLWVPNNGSA
jgi:hypothetical protein